MGLPTTYLPTKEVSLIERPTDAAPCYILYDERAFSLQDRLGNKILHQGNRDKIPFLVFGVGAGGRAAHIEGAHAFGVNHPQPESYPR